MKLAIGEYVPSNSIIHKMDPRVKILCNILFIVVIFLSNSFILDGVIFTSIFLIFGLAKMQFKKLITLIKPAIFLLVFIFMINMFLLKQTTNNYYWKWKFIEISNETITNSFRIFIRVYCMILITTILMTTTKPLDLARGIEDLMYPLKLIKFPVHIIAMIISIALRFIPTLLIEANRIMQAQASRGVDFKNGSFKAKIKSTTTLIIPLFVIAFGKAEDLANAMETRGYDPYAKRSRYHKYYPKWYDYLAMILIGGLFSFILIIYIGHGIIPLPSWWA